MSARDRAMIEETLFNLEYDMHHIGEGAEMRAELAAMTDTELIAVFNQYMEDYE